eukprot:411244_1
MIHNADGIVNDNNDSTSMNTIVMADMTASATSYTVPDILSYFYGISNSVVSTLDSISDIAFIVFLWNFSDLQNYSVDGETISKFMMVLSVGNLVSVAITIALYITTKVNTTTIWQKK